MKIPQGKDTEWDTEEKILTTCLFSHSLDHSNQKIQVEHGMSFYDFYQLRQRDQRTAFQGQSVILFLVFQGFLALYYIPLRVLNGTLQTPSGQMITVTKEI